MSKYKDFSDIDTSVLTGFLCGTAIMLMHCWGSEFSHNQMTHMDLATIFPTSVNCFSISI